MRELALHVMDIVQNSLSAGADKVLLELEEDLPRELLTIRISDNGKGMTGEPGTAGSASFLHHRPQKSGAGASSFSGSGKANRRRAFCRI